MATQMTITQFIDELTYRNYAHNRTISPSVSVERWEKAYGPNTEAMERRYSGELISGLQETVANIQGPTVEEREPCPDCFDTGEMVTRGYDSSDVQVESCHCPAGKVKR